MLVINSLVKFTFNGSYIICILMNYILLRELSHTLVAECSIRFVERIAYFIMTVVLACI